MIDYTYVVKEVNESTNSMIIEYSSPGRKTISVGAMLPLGGTKMDDYAFSFAPFSFWIQEEKGTYVPAVGLTGSYTATEIPNIEANIIGSESNVVSNIASIESNIVPDSKSIS